MQHQNNVTSQFGPRADAYVKSTVHAEGADLDHIEAVAKGIRPNRAADLGCGGGHVAYRLATAAAEVVAIDLSAPMLTVVRQTAEDKGFTNVETVQAAAEKLPFDDNEFDFLGCRFSAHHWRDFEAGIKQAHRILKSGSKAIFVDVVSNADPLFDTHLQAVELLRDTSHVRNHSVAEWSERLLRSGFAIQRITTWRKKMEFASWTARMATPPELQAAIRAVQNASSAETRAYFEIEDDGSFMLDMAMFEVVAS